MTTRVFEIAKELGIKSKAIVQKCHDEGIPPTVIKNHMSTVSAGLEATIRDWFGGHTGTAVETASKVDLEKVRSEPKRRAKPIKKAADAADDQSASTPDDSAVATAAPPKAKRPAKATPAPTASPAPTAPAQAPAPPKDSEPPSEPPVEELTPAAAAQPDTAAPETAAPDAGESDAAESTEPAPMNVPTRPKVITPAGPKLEEVVKEKVKLSGPKIVRVEAPEKIEPPRPRRVGGGGAPMPGGRGVGGPPGPPMAGGDRGRSPRRGGYNKRRSDSPSTPANQGGAGVSSRRRGRSAVTDRDWIGPGAFSEKDLAEREARLQRSGGYLKQHRQRLRQQQSERAVTAAQAGGKVTIAEPFSIKDLSAATGIKAADIVKKLFMQGVMATINSGIDAEKAQEIMMEYNIELDVIEAKSAEDVVTKSFTERQRADERDRGPVVTILGHVDHGKTSLLDKIRRANVAEGEAGGITQATSAFRVPVHVGDNDKQVVFIDTPGHEAFTAMRARGATITDIVVLVVAADDGVMPQTIESINHAKAAGVPIVVALNKIDKAEATDANIQRILGQLAEHELNPTDWGGDTEVIRTSAITGDGIQDLLEVLDYQAELLELKADFAGPARGTVIESSTAQGRGPVASVLVQEGELKVGDFIVAGRAFGRVRDITDDHGNRTKSVVPPNPVQISGLNEIPDAGDNFYIVDTLKKAQEAAEQRREREREAHLAQPKVTLDTLFSTMAENEMKEITVVLKADVQGSIDVLKEEMEKVASDEVRTRVIHAAVGGITESDVVLADASRAIIVGFNVIPSSKARQLAELKGVEIRNYRVIYDVVDDITKAAEGLLTPELREEVLGHAQVRQVFKVSKVGSVAGCYVTDGVVQRDALVRVTRDDVVIEHDRKLEQLKRFKDDAKEVRANMECGMKIVGYDDIKEGDILECYKQIEIARTL